MNIICRHARKIQEMYVSTSPTSADDVPPHVVGVDNRMAYAGWRKVVDIDDSDPSNWQCGWPLDDMPIAILRSAGGNSLRAGDCEKCKFFQPVDVAIPGTKNPARE